MKPDGCGKRSPLQKTSWPSDAPDGVMMFQPHLVVSSCATARVPSPFAMGSPHASCPKSASDNGVAFHATCGSDSGTSRRRTPQPVRRPSMARWSRPEFWGSARVPASTPVPASKSVATPPSAGATRLDPASVDVESPASAGTGAPLSTLPDGEGWRASHATQNAAASVQNARRMTTSTGRCSCRLSAATRWRVCADLRAMARMQTHPGKLSVLQLKVVAAGGLEPPTCGL